MFILGVVALWPAGLSSRATLAFDAAEPSTWRRAKLVLQQVPVGAGNHAWNSTRSASVDDDLPNGSRVVVLDLAKSTPIVSNLTGEFAAAGQPDVSPDGNRVLFSGRVHAEDSCSIWEIKADGTGLRKVLSRGSDCLEPIYLSTVYSIGQDEAVPHLAFRSRSSRGNWALYTCHVDGTDVRRITFGHGDARDACHLWDGRIAFSHWARNDASNQQPAVNSTLLTVFPDGTGVFPFSGQHRSLVVRSMLSQADDGRVVFVEAPLASSDVNPLVVAVSPTNSFASRTILADELAGAVRDPIAVSTDELLLAYRPRGSASYGIYALATSETQSPVEIYDAKAWHEICLKPLRSSSPKPGSASRVNIAMKTGLLYCLDSRLSSLHGVSASSDALPREVRVYSATQEATPKGGDTAGVLVGSFPVEQDGSFFLEVPAATPLRLETVDNNGRSIQVMSSSFWVMPNEKRGCIGCHEDRYSTPPNRRVRALQEGPICAGVTREKSNFGCRNAEATGGKRQ